MSNTLPMPFVPKLGKLPAVHDARSALLYNFLDHSALSGFEPAPSADWAVKLPDDVGMMGNDRMGNCTVCGSAHAIQLWTSNTGDTVTLTDQVVVDTYKMLTMRMNGRAYDPCDPTTDTGLALLDVLKFWRNEGIGGHKIGGWVKVNHHDIRELRIALQLFGALYTGVELPQRSMNEIGHVWDQVDGPIAGGHCMTAHAAHAEGARQVAAEARAVAEAATPAEARAAQVGMSFFTWGKRQPATWGWALKSIDEAYAILSEDWVSGALPSPSGFDMDKMRAYLAAL